MTTPITNDVSLRDITVDDLPILFEYQNDRDANYMAAFTSEDPYNREVFMERQTLNLANEAIVKKAIIFQGQVVGSIMGFELFGDPTIGYSIGKAYWGQGITSKAVAAYLAEITGRPLFARVAKDNSRSKRVLEKNGFVIVGEDKGFAYSRGAETEEYILRLD